MALHTRRNACWSLVTFLAVLGCAPDTVAPPQGGTTEGAADSTTSGEQGSVDADDSTTRSEPANPTLDPTGTTDIDPTGPATDTGMGEPEVVCTDDACSSSCASTYTYRDELDGGEACVCDTSPMPPDYLTCDLPDPCEGHGLACAIQALRYGVFGRIEVGGAGGKDVSMLSIDILGDGLARVQHTGYTHDCCGGVFVNDFADYGHPRGVLAPGDPIWDECLTETAGVLRSGLLHTPECLFPGGFGGTGTCQGPLTVCPEPPVAPDPEDCAAACPMAGDGVCDEAQGTGLCADGCDPIDCACETDVPGTCDEITAEGGTCPLASDADDCGL